MKNSTADLVVAGAGAAGLMAAVTAAERGLSVTVLEPNDRVGKKLRITGKGRCNLTNDCQPADFFRSVRTNAKFIKSAVYAFPPSAAMAFFEEAGVPLKTERGGRVFPVSDSAADVAGALERLALEKGVSFVRDRVKGVRLEEGRVAAVAGARGEYPCRAFAVCTGGASYPGTGSTGDGYRLARDLGLDVVPPRPALVPLEADPVCAELQGLSLRNAELRLTENGKTLYTERGELLFTHFGLSGPLVLTASCFLTGSDYSDVHISIDLKPALTPEQLDERVLRDFSGSLNKDLINSLDRLLPQKLIPVVIRLSGIDPRCKVNAVTKEQRRELCRHIKDLSVRVYGPRPMEEAIVTSGGVDVREIDPRTMQARKIPGLYFAGEVLDVDAFTGGFNLQIAWSTGRLAGMSVPASEGGNEP